MKMNRAAKWEYMKATHARYQKSRKKDKKRILDEFCPTYGCHRKYAIELLGKGPFPKDRPARKRRAPTYNGRLLDIVEFAWRKSGYLWSVRLREVLRLWMPAIRKRFHMTAEEEKRLLSISSAQIDRRLKDKKVLLRKKIFGTTKPGRMLKNIIRVRKGPWKVQRVGYTEADLVSHSGDCAQGDYAHTLNLTEIFSAWGGQRCVSGKGQKAVCDGLNDIRAALPFDLLGLDVDCGSEFINYHLHDYCKKDPKVELTRSRPNKKNDNAHIEQKNWSHVRRLLGYWRYDTEAAIAAINALYRKELYWFQNLFLPTVKMVEKVRIGSRIKRVYDDPRTPLDRLILAKMGTPDKVDYYRRLRDRLDPFQLAGDIDRKLKRIWAMASKTPRPSTHRPGRIPSYSQKKLAGPPHVPAILPNLQHYERTWRRNKFYESA